MSISQSCHKGKSGNEVNARKQFDNEALTRKISSNLDKLAIRSAVKIMPEDGGADGARTRDHRRDRPVF
jgi:hypothetical protein